MTGWYGGLIALAIANGLALVVTLALVAAGRTTRGARIAFEPYLVLGLVGAILAT